MALTTGQTLTAELRRYFSIGTRTRRSRHAEDLHLEMMCACTLAATEPGYYVERTQNALRPGFAAAMAYSKHIRGNRASVSVQAHIQCMTPWRFAALLGDMVDAGVTNNGEGERYFAGMN